MSAKLTIDDITDVRAYERQRPEYRQRVIALKKRRRVSVGPFVSLLFESRDTIRFQIQEMARAEKMVSDEAIQIELDTYNPLIPQPGRLTATVFIELTSKDELMTWLPKLVGIETRLELRIGSGDDLEVVPCVVDPAHEAQLTREEITASVHYVAFDLRPAQVDAFAVHPVSVAVTHPEYSHETELGRETVEELLGNLRG